MLLSLNGQLLDSSEARIDPFDRGFTLGDGLFETLAARGGAPLRLEQHLHRLGRGCAVLSLPPVPSSIADDIEALLKASALREAAIRITYTRGAGARGLPVPERQTPTLVITASPFPQHKPPLRCITAAVTRRNEYSPLSRIKTTNYLDNILAREEALAKGADDAILLNTKGRVTEATAANLFIVASGGLFTPPLEDGVLDGIMRRQIIGLTGAVERSLGRHDVGEAAEVFLSNSLGLQSVVSFDGVEISGGTPGTAFQDLAVSFA